MEKSQHYLVGHPFHGAHRRLRPSRTASSLSQISQLKPLNTSTASLSCTSHAIIPQKSWNSPFWTYLLETWPSREAGATSKIIRELDIYSLGAKSTIPAWVQIQCQNFNFQKLCSCTIPQKLPPPIPNTMSLRCNSLQLCCLHWQRWKCTMKKLTSNYDVFTWNCTPCPNTHAYTVKGIILEQLWPLPPHQVLDLHFGKQFTEFRQFTENFHHCTTPIFMKPTC